MKLHSLKIEGFRRIQSTQLLFGDATFLIGANNSGKSTVFRAMEYLLSGKKVIPIQEYYSVVDEDTGETKPAVSTIVLEAEFRNLPSEAKSWRGFKGRVFTYTTDEDDDSGLSVTYRKTYELGHDVKIEFRAKERKLDDTYSDCKTGQDYIDKGINQEVVIELFSDLSKNIGKSKGALEKLEELTVPELMLLILSAFFHDIGMAPEEKDVLSWKKVWDYSPEIDDEIDKSE
jgi:energy-coupling factor transporter ATP-binding protein EcfA2